MAKLKPSEHDVRIPLYARALTSIGELTYEAVQRLFDGHRDDELFAMQVPDDKEYQALADTLRHKHYRDENAAAIVDCIRLRRQPNSNFDLRPVIRWINANKDDSPVEDIVACMDVIPPSGMEVIMLLSRKGSQKVVFLGSWRQRQEEIVLKQIISHEARERILSRELAPHPLLMKHDNIIETFYFTNEHGEPFLVERRLEVLSDDLMSDGLEESTNLLYDMAKALKHLHVVELLVHGDIKPDNIGKNDGRYILLDFGLCRPIADHAQDVSATGSIRTRAPELLTQEHPIDPTKTDIWALGATVYNYVTGDFPLIKHKDSPIPRVSDIADRERFVEMVADRARNNYDEYVRFELVPQPLRDILQGMLCKDPKGRPDDALYLIKSIENVLAAYIRELEDNRHHSHFTPITELEKIESYLLNLDNDFDLVPIQRRNRIAYRLNQIEQMPGIDDKASIRIETWIEKLTGKQA